MTARPVCAGIFLIARAGLEKADCTVLTTATGGPGFIAKLYRIGQLLKEMGRTLERKE